MRKFSLMTVVVAMAAMLGVSFAGVASGAENCAHRFGSHQQVADGGGMQDWSVTDLKKSSDVAPGFPVAGQLWEATATVTAISGTSTPVIPNFNATSDGGNYPVLWQLATPQGISAATLAQGQTATGKIYFDATGGDPMAVIYSAGGAKPLMWCCSEAMMAMPMDTCMCCADMKEPCPCCAGKM
ncbi:MPT63 family protein [Mycolicibacterium sp. KC 300]|uniref:MPT63 family protein n=2 Tax=Mycolicibacterium arseniciresistens TaxID=3062257 RepID=A0ABT8UG09_9MYCO|nr:MPT63 family protein [Mycolicibacterium arseniciresistens]